MNGSLLVARSTASIVVYCTGRGSRLPSALALLFAAVRIGWLSSIERHSEHLQQLAEHQRLEPTVPCFLEGVTMLLFHFSHQLGQ